MDMSLNELREIGKDREAWCATTHRVAESNTTTEQQQMQSPCGCARGFVWLLRPVPRSRPASPWTLPQVGVLTPDPGSQEPWGNQRVLTMQVLDLKRSRKKPRLALSFAASGSQLLGVGPSSLEVLDGFRAHGSTREPVCLWVSPCLADQPPLTRISCPPGEPHKPEGLRSWSF